MIGADAAPKTAVVLIAHGTVESLDEIPELIANIRRGAPATPELVAEVRRRYEAIGGRSPLLTITRSVAKKVEARLALPTRVAMRLFRPYPKGVIAELAETGVRRIVVVPLAQHSAHVYGAAAKRAAAEIDPTLEVRAAPNWGTTPELTRAFAGVVLEALGRVPPEELDRTAIVYTAHSLPVAVAETGDPYEAELRRSAEDVAHAVAAHGGRARESVVAFQSQGIGSTVAWMGPDLRSTLAALAARGIAHVVLAPIGFLADHVEILYDLDVEAKAWAGELGIVLHRSASLNDSDALVDALVVVAGGLLGGRG